MWANNPAKGGGSPHINTRSFGTKRSSKITKESANPYSETGVLNFALGLGLVTWVISLTPSASAGTAKATE